MAISINSNIASLEAQRQLAKSTDALSSTFERLSSGLRINHPSDDAAGLAMSTSLSAQTRIYSQSIRNINDGLSMMSVAEGAITQLSSVVTRIQELAEQSANGTFSNTQRSTINLEAQALKAEYNRIVDTTKFNGINLLDQTTGDIRIQADGTDAQSALYINTSTTPNSIIPDGTFQALSSYATHTAPRAVQLGDFNGDGKLDFVTADNGSQTVTISLGNGDGSFRASTFAGVTGSNVFDAQIGDVNGDGKIDVITADFSGNGSTVLLGNGDGTLKAGVSYQAATNGPTDALLGDFNNDNKLDIVLGTAGVGIVSLLIGNGDGTFKSPTALTTDIAPASIVSGDFNGDGKLDIAAASGANVVDILIGRGNGTFNAALSFATGQDPQIATASDLNGDGKLDILVTDTSDGTISSLIGNGDGTFKARRSYVTGATPRGPSLADFNGDGILDALVTDGVTGFASLLLGNGDGSFKAKVSYADGGLSVDSTVGDINGDGVNDVLVANFGTSSVGVLLGHGTPSSHLANFDISTQSGALAAISTFATVHANLSLSLGKIGSYESRLGVVLNTQLSEKLNYEIANSRILDIDVAQETADLVVNQIRQSAAIAVLAQANQQPALILKLLGDVVSP